MTEIGAYDAKTHLPALLERVRRGERFIITKHGQPVAELRPFAAHDADQALRKELAGRGVRLRKILDEGESLRDLAHSGHRY